MNWQATLIWGFAATTILTTIIAGSRGLGFTRMDITFMLGSMFTSDRDKAKVIGFLFHFLNGWIFAFIYAAAFESAQLHTWWFGMAIGLVHSLFVLMSGLELVAAFHPRMASEQHGPDPTRLLEPPGFMAKHYGRETAAVSIIAHMIYGAVLGHFI